MINPVTLWEGLGSFWLDFENQRDIEYYWEGMLESMNEATLYAIYYYISQYPYYDVDVWENSYIDFPIILDGDESNRVGTSNQFYMPAQYTGIFSIPTLVGINTAEALVENTDYEIIDQNKIQFSTLPTWDTKYQNDNRVVMYAATTKAVNPITMYLLRLMNGIEEIIVKQEEYWPYTMDPTFAGAITDITYQTEKAIALKYINWGLYYLKQQIPSVSTLEKIYTILYNLPFAYEGGTASLVGQVLTIGDYSYELPVGESWAIIDTEVVTRFQPLTNGVEIKDRITHSDEIENLYNEVEWPAALLVTAELGGKAKYIREIVSRFNENHIGKGYILKSEVMPKNYDLYIGIGSLSGDVAGTGAVTGDLIDA